MWPHAPEVSKIGTDTSVCLIFQHLYTFSCLIHVFILRQCVKLGFSALFSSLIDRRGWLPLEEMIPTASTSEMELPTFVAKNDAHMVG